MPSAPATTGLPPRSTAIGTATEIVPGACTVLFDGVHDRASLREALAGWTPTADLPTGPLVEVPVTWDGSDLEAVAERWGCAAVDVGVRMAELELVSAFCGFAPGFAYLAGLPEAYAVPRLDSPRTRVPVGSVAIADRWCGIYPAASPGGWRLLGRFSPGREERVRETAAQRADEPDADYHRHRACHPAGRLNGVLVAVADGRHRH